MPPSMALLADLGARGSFVCRSCLTSLRATAAQRPQWTAGGGAESLTSPLPLRAISTQTAGRSRGQRAEPVPRPSVRRRERPSTSQQRQPQAALDLDHDLDFDLDNKEGLTVRLFEQDDDGGLRQVRDEEVDSDGNYKGDELDQEIERQLAELEGKLRDTAQLVQRLEKSGPAKKRADRLRRKYALFREAEREGAKGKGKGKTAAKTEVESGKCDEAYHFTRAIRIDEAGLSANARRNVRNLNSVLRLAAWQLQTGDGMEDKIISALYSRYGVARTSLAESWSNVPAAAWACLWEVLGWDSSSSDTKKKKTKTKPGPKARNPRRMAHIYYLAKDMQAAGVALTDEQQLLAMEAMFVEGWPAVALDNWKRGAATLGAQPETATDYWELGVRMCALHGDLERAERAAERLFGLGGAGEEKAGEEKREKRGKRGERELGRVAKKKANPRVLFQLIRAAAAQDDTATATAAYRRLQDVLGRESMTIEDYDEVVSCFLSANQTEQAFAVFVDMMFAGAVNVRPKRSKNTGSRDRAAPLPPSVANQFFFGKWLKRLIGAGDLDGALRVLLFMQVHGVMPAAVQVNGLLGAWLRTGTAAYQARADALAWRMIASRRLFVDLRRRSAQLAWKVQLQAAAKAGREEEAARRPGKAETEKTGNPESPELPEKADIDPLAAFVVVPRASLETFALMAENYKDRGQVARLEALWVAFQECEMVPSSSSSSSSTFMMNQLLASYLHDGRPDEARNMYARMRASSAAGTISPNIHTFLVLFRTLAVHRLPSSSLADDQRNADAQVCRQLFAEMAASAATTADKDEHNSNKNSNNMLVSGDDALPYVAALGRLVLHSFRKTGDYVGLIVAVRTLRPILSGRFAVSDRLAVELVAEAPLTGSNESAAHRRSSNPALRRRILRASELVDTLLRERGQLRQRLRQQQQRQRQHPSQSPDHDHDLAASNLAEDLAAIVAHYYRHKCGVEDAAFEAMHADAVRQLGVARLL